MADATRKRLVFVVDKQGKSVIDPPSRYVHCNAYDTLQSIFDNLKDVPSCEVLHVVFKQNALSDPARDSQYDDLYDLIKDCEADMVQALACCALWWTAKKCRPVHLQLGRPFKP